MTRVVLKTAVHVRRVVRSDLFQNVTKTSRHVARNAALSVAPSFVTSYVIDHAPVNVDSFIHILVDDASTSSVTWIVAMALMTIPK
jgi:hypothetical protein